MSNGRSLWGFWRRKISRRVFWRKSMETREFWRPRKAQEYPVDRCTFSRCAFRGKSLIMVGSWVRVLSYLQRRKNTDDHFVFRWRRVTIVSRLTSPLFRSIAALIWRHFIGKKCFSALCGGGGRSVGIEVTLRGLSKGCFGHKGRSVFVSLIPSACGGPTKTWKFTNVFWRPVECSVWGVRVGHFYRGQS